MRTWLGGGLQSATENHTVLNQENGRARKQFVILSARPESSGLARRTLRFACARKSQNARSFAPSRQAGTPLRMTSL